MDGEERKKNKHMCLQWPAMLATANTQESWFKILYNFTFLLFGEIILIKRNKIKLKEFILGRKIHI